MNSAWRLCLTGVALCVLAAAGYGQDALGGPGDPLGELLGDGGDSPAGGSSAVVLPDVPSYLWYHGCGPTAAGMIVGYWDAHGYGNLIPGSNDWVTNQTAVKAMIASPGHIRDYVPTPNRTPTTEDPWHANDCVADWIQCSKNPDNYGWAYYSKQDDGLRNYAIYRGYAGSGAYNVSYSSLWSQFTSAIDNGHPVEFLVDSSGNGSTDHFVAAIGYDTDGGVLRYACRDTWSHTIRWEDYHGLQSGNAWGVYGGTFFTPVPEPTCLLPVCLAAMVLRRRRKR